MAVSEALAQNPRVQANSNFQLILQIVGSAITYIKGRRGVS